MNKLKKILRQIEFHVLLVCVFINLFNWPFLDVPGRHGPVGMLVYIMVVWVTMIALLFFISRSMRESREGEDRVIKGVDPDV